MQRVRQFIEQTFDEASVGLLLDTVEQVGSDASSVPVDAFAEEKIEQQVQMYCRARQLLEGDASELWDKFVERRKDLRSKSPAGRAAQTLEGVTAGSVPSPEQIQEALADAEDFRVEEEQDDLEGKGNTGGGKDSPPNWEDFFDQFDLEDQEEETEAELQTLFDQLNEEADGRIVLIRDPSAR